MDDNELRQSIKENKLGDLSRRIWLICCKRYTDKNTRGIIYDKVMENIIVELFLKNY